MSVSTGIDVEELKVEMDEYGYVIIKELIPSDDALRMADRLMEIMLQQPDAGKPNQNLGGMFNYFEPEELPLFTTLITNPVFLEISRHLLGDQFMLAGSGCNWWKPGAPAQGLHADVPVGWMLGNGLPVPNVCLMVNCLWMLTEFTAGNGATRVVPFSHLSGRVPRTGVDYRHRVAAEGPPGSIIIFDGRIWHQAGENVSKDSQRVGVSSGYCSGMIDPTGPATNWVMLKQSVWDRMPKLVQEMSPHVIEG